MNTFCFSFLLSFFSSRRTYKMKEQILIGSFFLGHKAICCLELKSGAATGQCAIVIRSCNRSVCSRYPELHATGQCNLVIRSCNRSVRSRYPELQQVSALSLSGFYSLSFKFLIDSELNRMWSILSVAVYYVSIFRFLLTLKLFLMYSSTLYILEKIQLYEAKNPANIVIFFILQII